MMDAMQDAEPPGKPEKTGPDVPWACDTCGQDAEIEIEGRSWCASCLHALGSCCGESDKDGCPD
jgi:hypothetical protein